MYEEGSRTPYKASEIAYLCGYFNFCMLTAILF